MHKEQLQIPIIKPSSNLAPVTSVTTTDRPRTSQRAPSKPKGHLQKNLLFPLESAPSKHVPPFLQGCPVHRRGRQTNFRHTSRHHSEMLHGLGSHIGSAKQPSLTPGRKIPKFKSVLEPCDPFSRTLFCFP